MQFSRCILSFLFGGHLLSHAVASVVPSAVRGLTFVFGMGTGVAPERIAAKTFRYPSPGLLLPRVLDN